MNLSIVVPCYNEADNVEKIRDEFFPVVGALAQTRSVEVIFVDDGSRDGTWDALTGAFTNFPLPNVTVRFEKHPVNRGLGAAMRTGFAAARGEVIVTTDSDGTYQFQTIPDLLACLTPGVDMVTASPYHPRGAIVGVPAWRLFFSRGSSLMYRLIADWNVNTYTCLFRAYRREVIERVPFEANGFLAGTELMVNAMMLGYRVAEYPAVLHSRMHGVSKAKITRTILAHLGYQGEVLLRRLHLKRRVAPREAGATR
ncbi:MAG: glycosyltransferase family 2 protein [Chloroflexi bacterium]|nr:glycosyltransferase family 2 protein [Chloroflexota bacterium]